MSNRTGLWIDHREAIVVELTGQRARVDRVASDVETHHQGSAPFEARRVPADDRRQRALTQHLNAYYDRVAARIEDAGSLLVLGPGEAKGEFVKRLDHTPLAARVSAVETADRMTDRQVCARVRKFFAARRLVE